MKFGHLWHLLNCFHPGSMWWVNKPTVSATVQPQKPHIYRWYTYSLPLTKLLGNTNSCLSSALQLFLIPTLQVLSIRDRLRYCILKQSAWVPVQARLLIPHLIHTTGGSRWGLNLCGDQEWAPGSWLQPGPELAHVGTWTINQRMGYFSVSHLPLPIPPFK